MTEAGKTPGNRLSTTADRLKSSDNSYTHSLIRASEKPHRGFSSLVCQQPGSPGWPQQDRKWITLIQLFFIRSHNFLGQGIGLRRLVRKDRGFGLFIIFYFIRIRFDCPRDIQRIQKEEVFPVHPCGILPKARCRESPIFCSFFCRKIHTRKGFYEGLHLSQTSLKSEGSFHIPRLGMSFAVIRAMTDNHLKIGKK